MHDSDSTYLINHHPLTLRDYARVRAEALAKYPGAIMGLRRGQVADLIAEWVQQCETMGHATPLPFSLPGRWTIIDDGLADVVGGVELHPSPIVRPAPSLRECERDILAQVYRTLWHALDGDTSLVAEVMLGRRDRGRQTQLRMAALGVGPRSLRRARRGVES